MTRVFSGQRLNLMIPKQQNAIKNQAGQRKAAKEQMAAACYFRVAIGNKDTNNFSTSKKLI